MFKIKMMENLLKQFREHVHSELSRSLDLEKNMCRAVTKSNKRCTNKASCHGMTLCKKHKNFEIVERKAPTFIIYHNHLPHEKSDDCPKCLSLQTNQGRLIDL